MAELSRAQARRVALAAQGFLDRRHAAPDLRTLRRTVRRTGVLQIDSVNVLQRAHYMPLVRPDGSLRHRGAGPRCGTGAAPTGGVLGARRGVHARGAVAAHAAPDAGYRDRGHPWLEGHDHGLVASLLAELRERGRRTSRDLDDGLPRRKAHWGWNWSETKKALEYLFLSGELAIAGRNSQFERLYDLPERVLPREVLALPVPTDEEAHRELIRRAAMSHGVATARCLRDYYRMHTDQAGPAIAALVEDGELVPVRVEGWNRPTFLHRDARVPRRVEARALLSPFDPIVWERERTEALFDFRYRIEIYVPERKRVHGYYVLPFLLGDRIVARVDLKADRAARTLRVLAAYAEPTAPPETASELAAELASLAGWLGLDGIRVSARGDLARPLAALLSG